MLQAVASGINKIPLDCVFVGGAIAELYVTNTETETEEVRPTDDVDLVVNILTQKEYHRIEQKLRSAAFKNDMSEDAPICRWIYSGVKVDIMPIDKEVLGFSNRWYRYGFENRKACTLPNNEVIYILPLVLYIATKLEAVISRGSDDLRMSHDFEDIVYLCNNADGISELYTSSNVEVKKYLKEAFSQLYALPEFEEAVYGLLPYGDKDRAEHVFFIINLLSGNS